MFVASRHRKLLGPPAIKVCVGFIIWSTSCSLLGSCQVVPRQDTGLIFSSKSAQLPQQDAEVYLALRFYRYGPDRIYYQCVTLKNAKDRKQYKNLWNAHYYKGDLGRV